MSFYKNNSSAPTPLVIAEGWLDSAVRWPLRILIAAFVCPIIISMAGQVQFLFPWDMMGDGAGAAGALAVLVPLITAGVLFASKFPSSVDARGMTCFGAGLLSLAVLSFQSSWVMGIACSALIGVAAGNRVSKQFVDVKAPRILAAVSGAILVTLCLWPVAGSSMVGALFTSATWSGGGWMFCLAIVGLLVYAGSAIGLVVPAIDSERLQTTISRTVRGLLVWMPACLIFGRLSVGPQIGMFDGGGVTTITMGFKVFGTVYPILICSAVGIAAWLTAWLANNTDLPSSGEDPFLPENKTQKDYASV